MLTPNTFDRLQSAQVKLVTEEKGLSRDTMEELAST